MKIFFCGAHGSGKTTLCRYVADKYKLPILPEAARAVLAEKELQLDSLRSNIDLVNSYQQSVFARQIAEEAKHESFVSDRSLIDCVAYSAAHSQIAHELFADKALTDYVKRLTQDKSVIFFVRPSKATLKNDGVRETISWDGVVAIDAMVKLLFNIFDIRYFQVNSDSMQERASMIDAVLSLVA